MAIEDTGFEIKRYDEIRKEINEEFSTNAGVSIDTSSDSIANLMNSIEARQLALLWELGESINDSTDITKAEGQALDNLALQVGLLREPDKQSYGIAWFTGNNGVTIPTTAVVATARGDEFQPTNEVIISPSSCLQCTLTVNTVLDSTEYQVSVEGTQYNFTSTIGATEESIIIGLAGELTAGSSEFTTTIVDDNKLVLESTDLTSGNTMTVTATTYMSYSDVTSLGLVESLEYGFIEGAAYTLTFISTPINGWSSVSNPSDMTLGRFTQTDDELRTSILTNYDIKDSVTYQGIKDAVEEVSGVTSVGIFDNIEFYTQNFNSVDVGGKGYMVTVDGGLPADIGQIIWDTKPAGIHTYGTETVLVTDEDGQEQTVHYSESSKQFFYIKITYTKYDEEDFPVGGETFIKDSCLLYGDTIEIGEDVIPQRFIGAIYDDVTGIDALTVEVAFSTNPSLPINDGSLTYTASRVPMSSAQAPLFATNRMEVTLV